MTSGNLTRRQLLLGTAGAAAAVGAAQGRPNIVFLFSDDHHFQCLGAAGNPHIHTPNLDRLAARGVLFTNGIITTSQCAPSRGIMLSGLETYQSGLLSNGQRSFRPGFGPTAVERMRRSGYDTVLVGKWHIQPHPEECGFARAPLWFPPGSMRYVNPTMRRGLEGKDETVPGHITDLLTDHAASFLRNARQPFLLWLAYNAPHAPWHADDKYRRHYEGKNPSEIAPPLHTPGGREFDWVTYYSVITHLDEAVGRLVRELEVTGLWKNTVVFFLGDNGYMCGARGLTGKVVPWEASVRVPFLAAGGPVAARGPVDSPVASIDVTATWLEMEGIESAFPLAGRSLGRLLAGEKDEEREAAFSTWDDGRITALAVRRRVEPYRLVRTRRHKYILWESRREELYDWQADPGEQRNLAEDPRHTSTARRLKDLLAARMHQTSDHARSWLG